MPKFQIILEDVMPSRTPSRITKTIEAIDIADARKQADNDPEVAWGYKRVVSVTEVS